MYHILKSMLSSVFQSTWLAHSQALPTKEIVSLEHLITCHQFNFPWFLYGPWQHPWIDNCWYHKHFGWIITFILDFHMVLAILMTWESGKCISILMMLAWSMLQAKVKLLAAAPAIAQLVLQVFWILGAIARLHYQCDHKGRSNQVGMEVAHEVD